MTSSLRALTIALVSLIALVSAAAALPACGGEDGEDAQKLSELTDADFVAECNASRREAGADALIGFGHYTCLAPSNIGGSCNMNVFDNCVSVAVTACAAPGSNSPLRTCSATLEELHACTVAHSMQYSAYRNTNCTTPATTTPKPQAEVSACAALCSKCPTACQ